MQLYLLTIFLPTALCALQWLNRFRLCFRGPFFSKTLRPLKPGRHKLVMKLDALLPRHDKNLVEQLTNLESCYAKGLSEKKGHDSTLELNKYQSRYGSISDGLVVEKGIDREAFGERLATGVNYAKLTPKKGLSKLLEEANVDIIVLTNFDPKHVTRILEHLNIEPYINVIFAPTFEETNPSSQKTSAEEAFAQIKDSLEADSKLITYVDDLGQHFLDKKVSPEKVVDAGIHPEIVEITARAGDEEAKRFIKSIMDSMR